MLIRRDGEVVQYVPFGARAWHAGASSWHGRPACNDFSIGIELEGTDDDALRRMPSTRRWPALIRAACAAYPTLSRERVVGHSDIAPGRKSDPGAAFDWERLRGLARLRYRQALGPRSRRHSASLPPSLARQHARHHEQQVGEAIEVAQRVGADRLAACASAQQRRSARRQTARAKWQAAAALPPPGSTNSFSGGSSALSASSTCFQPLDLRRADATLPGMASSPPRSNRSCWISIRQLRDRRRQSRDAPAARRARS